MRPCNSRVFPDETLVYIIVSVSCICRYCCCLIAYVQQFFENCLHFFEGWKRELFWQHEIAQCSMYTFCTVAVALIDKYDLYAVTSIGWKFVVSKAPALSTLIICKMCAWQIFSMPKKIRVFNPQKRYFERKHFFPSPDSSLQQCLRWKGAT